MLDLGSLLVSMGLQSEMQTVRKDIEEAQVFGEDLETESTSPVVDAVASTLESVENAASAVVNALAPPSEAVAGVLDACAIQAPSVDLSLPTAPVCTK